MKYLIAFLLLFPSLAFGITFVQSKAANTGSGAAAASLTITLGANATVGNTLVVAWSGAQAISKITYGTKTWCPQVQQGNASTSICYFPVREVSNSIVITMGVSSRMAAIAIEYSGTLIAVDIPPLAATNAGTTTNTTGTTAATSYANELVLAGMATGGGVNNTYAAEQTAWLTSITNSFASVLQTSSFSNASGQDRAIAIVSRAVTATGTYSTAGTQASSPWSNFIMSFVDNPNTTCVPGATATPSATSTPTATSTATATSTSTATPTATATASFTPCAPTPTATATFTPSATASATFTPTPTSTVEASYLFPQ